MRSQIRLNNVTEMHLTQRKANINSTSCRLDWTGWRSMEWGRDENRNQSTQYGQTWQFIEFLNSRIRCADTLRHSKRHTKHVIMFDTMTSLCLCNQLTFKFKRLLIHAICYSQSVSRSDIIKNSTTKRRRQCCTAYAYVMWRSSILFRIPVKLHPMRMLMTMIQMDFHWNSSNGNTIFVFPLIHLCRWRRFDIFRLTIV